MKKIVKALRSKYKVMGILNLCALIAVVQNVNVACVWAIHQPELPEEAKKFRKF